MWFIQGAQGIPVEEKVRQGREGSPQRVRCQANLPHGQLDLHPTGDSGNTHPDNPIQVRELVFAHGWLTAVGEGDGFISLLVRCATGTIRAGSGCQGSHRQRDADGGGMQVEGSSCRMA